MGTSSLLVIRGWVLSRLARAGAVGLANWVVGGLGESPKAQTHISTIYL
jgi:hypothetical protein